MSEWFRTPDETGGGRNWSIRLSIHARWLRTFIAARSGDIEAVDELYQEVALAVLKQKPQVPDESVAPWLYRVAVRQALLHRRRLGRTRRLQNNLVTQRTTGAEDVSDPLTWLLSDERQQLVRRAIQQLSTKDAELLLLKYTEEWSYHELADHLGVSHSAVEARLHRARQRLRAELAALEVVEADR
jgi:RNA polymerase sigma factor (sigma-70 family)